jgi:hypothetical protein
MKFGSIVGVETSRHCRSKALAAKHTASLQLLCTVGGNQARLDARTEFKILEPSPKGGVEAGRAHHCIVEDSIREVTKDENIYNKRSYHVSRKLLWMFVNPPPPNIYKVT